MLSGSCIFDHNGPNCGVQSLTGDENRGLKINFLRSDEEKVKETCFETSLKDTKKRLDILSRDMTDFTRRSIVVHRNVNLTIPYKKQRL